MINKRPEEYKPAQMERQEKGDKRAQPLASAVPTPAQSSTSSPEHSEMLGCVFPNTDKHTQDITTSLQNITWPRSNRHNVLGHGCCLGATANTAGPYSHTLTHRHAGLVRLINKSIRTALAGRTFYWGSLQINYNALSNPHVDKNNLGTSLLSLYGDFEQGSFHMQDHSLQLTSAQQGQCLCFDGTKPHYSTVY